MESIPKAPTPPGPHKHVSSKPDHLRPPTTLTSRGTADGVLTVVPRCDDRLKGVSDSWIHTQEHLFQMIQTPPRRKPMATLAPHPQPAAGPDGQGP